MSGFDNNKKGSFLATIPVASIELDDDTLTKRCKFNFSYFYKQQASQSFDEWDHGQLIKLFEKIKDYSNDSLNHWRKQPIGKKSGHVLEVYGAFPSNSDFTLPKHVPHQAQWGRFRLESAVRLVGFVLPSDYNNKFHSCGERYDCNTFYVVFLDKEHAFYKMERK
ncbi:hypothetical protein ACL9RI_18360 [Janthinobacterium sp. Mn2066]|uniref:hypothetical protein n=1 Tax=Janthinobacterium sp. Mn2066 TaxID=3395264 RepID=UPI003BECBB6E